MERMQIDALLQVLRQDRRFVTADGSVLRHAVTEAALRADEGLLRLLLSDETLRKRFFTQVSGVLVFDKQQLAWTLANRQLLPDSYTRFANRIGLNDETGTALGAVNRVELVFPFKDCMLSGEQHGEEERREERFYHETLSAEDIDRLLSPKVLVNTVRYTPAGTKRTAQLGETDNLLIKGNNLLALACLCERYAGQVKCIYIDPPYNTQSKTDTFGYNDAFKHSSWLTFMKNRLELARELLRDDGCIFVQCDDHEQAYLKVLCDEIFGRDNFICTVIWEKKYAPQNDARYLSDNHDFLLLYARNAEHWRPQLLPRTQEMDSRYQNRDHDPRGPWTSGDLSVKTYNEDYDYPITTPAGRVVSPPPGRCWRCSRERFAQLQADNRIWFSSKNVPRLKRFLSEVKQGQTALTIWKKEEVGHNQDAVRELQKLGLQGTFKTPKPERLLERVLTLGSSPGDLVLDFFAGSGTTLAVAHKMGRRWLGVEQMDYVQTLTAARLQQVIAGEQGGVSRTQEWKGGGSFVYCELATLNAGEMEAIMQARESAQLQEIWQRMRTRGFISHRCRPSDLDAQWQDFEQLAFADQQRLLLALLDKNLLYVNYSDLEDEEFAIAQEDRQFTRSFYDRRQEI